MLFGSSPDELPRVTFDRGDVGFGFNKFGEKRNHASITRENDAANFATEIFGLEETDGFGKLGSEIIKMSVEDFEDLTFDLVLIETKFEDKLTGLIFANAKTVSDALTKTPIPPGMERTRRGWSL